VHNSHENKKCEKNEMHKIKQNETVSISMVQGNMLSFVWHAFWNGSNRGQCSLWCLYV